ncbi:MAG: TniQ family protein [Hydrogenophaga sp.]|nr:TniQ family protein [Hydrogenophaga sp.]
MKLVDVPNHEFMESPSSWLTRVALRQVVSTQELARFFGLKVGTDWEMRFGLHSLDELASSHTMASGSFKMVDSVLSRLARLDPSGQRYLLSHSGMAYHRFCPACLANDRIKYFRVEWRFNCWRWCPLHKCLLLDCCPHCKKRVALPGNMFTAGPTEQGVASLDRCLYCAKQLVVGWKSAIGSIKPDLISSWEETLLNNGRAVLAALAEGSLHFPGESRSRSFLRIKKIERLGFLPHKNFRLTQDELLHRSRSSRM